MIKWIVWYVLASLVVPAASAQDLILNELLADPPTATKCAGFGLPDDCGDANGDGVRHFRDDEFVELINVGATPVDLGGYSLSDADGVRHLFPSPTLLNAQEAILVFGGGTPMNLPTLAQLASNGSLNLNNDGDTVSLKNPEGMTVAAHTYGAEGNDGQSLTRSPEGTGPFVKHTEATGANGMLFSPGTAVDGGLLPVEWVFFDASLDGPRVLLRWETASETNNAGFELQHQSPVLPTWEALAFIQGSGTTLEPRHYRHVVGGLLPGLHRFRLKQIDTDGTSAYSPAVEAFVDLSQPVDVSTPYPNPFQHATAFTVSVARTQHVEIALYDLLGRRVVVLYAGMLKGQATHAFRLAGTSLKAGPYLLRVTGTAFSTGRPLLLVK